MAFATHAHAHVEEIKLYNMLKVIKFRPVVWVLSWAKNLNSELCIFNYIIRPYGILTTYL